MSKYQVIIERCVVYEVEAYDQQDAEDLAWGKFNNDDLSDPFVAEVMEMEND